LEQRRDEHHDDGQHQHDDKGVTLMSALKDPLAPTSIAMTVS
jgi:hypothetical protein